jgi:WD40 repeat protein
MNWPESQDYNEAIQNPASSFADPALKSGQVVVNALGLPVPRSGSFADVYQFTGADGKVWALKCFTRKVAGLQERYAKIDEHIGKANFPFTVGFKYLAEGVRVRGQWFPLLKMEWVEGFTLNEFVRDNADKPQYLHALLQMWGKLTGRLRDANFAHADLQHGNVLLVPGDSQTKLGLRLIDYDGMWVPALAEIHSGEIGHPNYQHPLRLKDRLYNADVDRFPHLVIATALRGALLGGKDLWDEFDNGDNLLFKESDLRDPASAKVFKSLWALKDDVLCALVGKMALAVREPLRKTPWLDDLLLDEDGARLTDEEEKKVIQMLRVAPHFTASKSTRVAVAAAAATEAVVPIGNAFSDFRADDDTDERRSLPRRAAKPKPAKRSKKTQAQSFLPYYVGGGIAGVLIIGLLVAMLGGKKGEPKRPEVAKGDATNASSYVSPVEPPPRKDVRNDTRSGSTKDDKKNMPDDGKQGPPTTQMGPADGPPTMVPPPEAPPQAVAKTLGEFAEIWRNDAVGSLNFTGDNSCVTAASQGVVRTYSLKDGNLLDTFKVADRTSNANFDFLGDGNWLVRTTPIKGSPEIFAWAPNARTRGVVIGDDAVSYFRPPAIAAKANTILIGLKNGGIGVYSLLDGHKIEALTLPGKAPPHGLATSADGEAVLAHLAPNLLYFRPRKGEPFKALPLEYKIGPPPTVRLSPDGKSYLQFGSNRNVIQVYDTATGAVTATLSGHTQPVAQAYFMPDGKRVLSAGDTTMRLWDIAKAAELKQIALAGIASNNMTVSSDAQYAIAGSTAPANTQLFRLPSEESAPLVKVGPAANGPVAEIQQAWRINELACREGLAFSNDGNQVVSTPGTPAEIRLFDAKTGGPLKSFKVSNAAVMSISICPDDLLIICDRAASLTMWNLKTQKFNSPFQVTPGSPYAVSVAGEAGTVWVANQTDTIGVVNLNDAQTAGAFRVLTLDPIAHLATSADGHASVAINTKGDVFTLSQAAQTPRRPGPGLPGPAPQGPQYKPAGRLTDIHKVVLSPDGKSLLAAGANSSLRLYDMVAGNEQRSFEGQTGNVASAAFSRNGKFVMGVAADKTFRLWETETGRQIQDVKLPGAGVSIAVSPDGRYAVTSTEKPNSVQMWRLPDNVAP